MSESVDLYMGEAVGTYVGSAGKVISAILQTAGLFAQSSILEGVRTNLASFGALIYIVAIISALISVALYGNYRRGSYLLIGPALFYWMLNDTVDAGPTAVRYGNRTFASSGEEQINFLKQISDPAKYSSKPKISYFYAEFDNLVSSLVQNLVAFLINTENKQDLINEGKERVYSKVLALRGSTVGFSSLVSLGIAGHCADVLSLSQRRAALTKNGEPTTDNALSEELQRLTAEYNTQKTLRVINLTNELRDYLGSIGFVNIQEPTNCEEIWNFTKTASLKEAEQQLASATTDTEGNSKVPWDKVKEEIGKTFSEDDPGKATEVVAAHIFKNTLSQVPAQAMSGRLASRANFDPLVYNAVFRDVADAYSQGGFLMVQYFAASIPYIQGLLLFILSGAFPFFTIFLLMPSRASSFFVWMSLWVWVKSWDVGFAFIDFLKDFLFPFFTQGARDSAAAINWDDPSSVYGVVTQNDPLATYNTYITIISLITVSVPAMTAHFCMGATNLYDAFKMSIDKTANKFGQNRTNEARRVYANKTEMKNQRESVAFAERRAEAARSKEKSMTANGVDRNKEGRGAMSKHMQAEYQRGQFDYHYGQGQTNGAMLALHTGRKSTRGVGLAENFTLANKQDMDETNNTRNLGTEGTKLPGLASDNYAPKDDKISSADTSNPSVTDSGGHD